MFYKHMKRRIIINVYLLYLVIIITNSNARNLSEEDCLVLSLQVHIKKIFHTINDNLVLGVRHEMP